MTLAWHCLAALAVLAPMASGACVATDPMIGAVSTRMPQNHTVVIDAGSSGSRIRVYSWNNEQDLLKLPKFREVFCHSLKSGVSECETHQELTKHILELVGEAAKYVPADLHKTSSIYFMATAGMRMMADEKSKEAIRIIEGLLMNSTLNPFHYVPSPDNPRILSGEEEGLFAWIAANYLSKAFDTYGRRNRNTTGILELGGASTQIAFVPVGNILAGKFPVHLAGVTYNLYVHSYLIYGQDMVDAWIKERVFQASKPPRNNLTVANPCMLKGDVIVNKTNVTFYGTGDPANCTQLLNELIYEPVEPWRCNPKPCGIGTAYQPSIHPKQQFLAVGAFGYPLRGFQVLDSEGRFSFEATTKAAFNFCSMHIDTIRGIRNISMTIEDGRVRSRYLSRECLTGLYMPILFTKAYRFTDAAQQIRAPRSLAGTEIEWPLGAVIYEYERSRCKPHCIQSLGTSCVLANRSSSTLNSCSLPFLLGYFLIYGLGLPAIFSFLS